MFLSNGNHFVNTSAEERFCRDRNRVHGKLLIHVSSNREIGPPHLDRASPRRQNLISEEYRLVELCVERTDD